jgi:hypothetical protein
MRSRFGQIIALAASLAGPEMVVNISRDPFERFSALPMLLPKQSAQVRRSARGRGAQAKPRKRPNRATISARVRRRHRRAK